MADVVRLQLPGRVPGHLDVSFDAVAKLAAGLARGVDGVAADERSRRRWQLGRGNVHPTRATVTRARDEARIELTVDAWWGTPLADLVVRVRREVSEGLNASLGTNWDPETIVVQLGSLPVRTDPPGGTS